MVRERFTLSVPTLAGTHHLVPAYHVVFVNTVNGDVSLVNEHAQEDLARVRFDDAELPLVRTLIERWPSYVEYQILCPLVESGELSEVQTLLQGCQERLSEIGLSARWERDYGFLLTATERKEQTHE